MKASELIKRLQEFPGDVDVAIFDPMEQFLTVSDERFKLVSAYESTGEYDDEGELIETETECLMIFTEGEE